jgi:membrane-associated phospholipid phosphatase
MAPGVSLTPPGPPDGSRGQAARSPDRSEVWAGIALTALSVITALVVAFHPAATAIDRWGFSSIARSPDSTILIRITYLGKPVVLVAAAILAALAVVRRDRRRALACVAGPFVAALLVEYAIKPLVGRHFEGVLSYPSGNVSNVTAVATAWAVAVPRRYYPTDALGGGLFGVGTVLLVDGVLHLPEIDRWLPPVLRPLRPPEHASPGDG